MADEPVQPDPNEELPAEPSADTELPARLPIDADLTKPAPDAPAAEPAPVDEESASAAPGAAEPDTQPLRLGNAIDQSELDALADELARVQGEQTQRKTRAAAPQQHKIDQSELDALGAALGNTAAAAAAGDAASPEVDDLTAMMAEAVAAEKAAQPAGEAEDPAVVGHTPVTVHPENAAEFEPPELRADEAEDLTTIDMLDDVQLDVKIELGRTHMQIEDVLRLGPGSVVELDKLAGDPVDIYVNERLIARGEVLVLNDNFCVRINDIHSPIPELDEG